MTIISSNIIVDRDRELSLATTLLNGKRSGIIFTKQKNTALFQTLNYKCDGKDVCLSSVNSFVYHHRSYNREPINTDTFFIIPNDGINMFLEFVYTDINNIAHAYKLIHETTRDVILEVLDKVNEKIKNIVIRIYIEDGYKNNKYYIKIFKPTNYKTIGTTIVANTAKAFKYIKIPKTNKNFKYDEYLYLSNDTIKLNVQVEHSEKMEEHKSNLVEAVLRYYSTGDFISDAINNEIEEIFNFFGYERINNRYKLSKDGRTVISKDSIIYKAFPAFWNKHNE